MFADVCEECVVEVNELVEHPVRSYAEMKRQTVTEDHAYRWIGPASDSH